jgi:trehalose 6-phosphate synthase
MECHKVKRLIVVSNRVQPPSEDEPGNQGGLTVALSTVLRESNGIWFGWSGGETESFTGHQFPEIGGRDHRHGGPGAAGYPGIL